MNLCNPKPAHPLARSLRMTFAAAPFAAACATLALAAGNARADAAAGGVESPLLAIATPPADTPAARALDESYAVRLHDRIAASADYPNSREARQLQPTGAVGLWIEIDRQGHVLDAKITSGSGQRLLDLQALHTLRNLRYPAFPAQAYAGEASHGFAMTLDYAPTRP